MGLGHGLRNVLLDPSFKICKQILQFIGNQCICRTDFDIGIVQSNPLPTLFFTRFSAYQCPGTLRKNVEILEF